MENSKIEVLQAGIQTAIQDVTGRLGYWDVGVPPSGAIDPLSLTVANQLLANEPNTAGLECTLQGPTLKFHCDSQIVITVVTCLQNLMANLCRCGKPLM